MNIIDAIKNSVLEQFNGSISVEMILISLLVSFVISLFIVFVYKKTFSGVVYNKTIVMTIVMIAMVTSMVIRTINSNLSLSLGMVGALSIIRFRTAIKEPMDTAFLFWSIVSGIMCVAGLYFIAVCGSLLLGLLFYVLYLMDIKAKSQYLLVVIYKSENSQVVESKLEGLTKKKLKSKSVNGNNVIEVTYDVEYDNTVDELMKSLSGDVRNVNLVTYTNDYGL